MKKNLKLTLMNLVLFVTMGSLMGQITEISDFAKRPQYFQGKVLTLKNVKIMNASLDEESNVSKRGGKKIEPKTNSRSKSEKLFLVHVNPPCPAKKGWANIYPEIPDIKMHICFSMPNRMFEQMPKGSYYYADITFMVDVRGSCEIRKVKVL